MDMGTNTPGALRHVLNLKQAGDYNIAVRYTGNTRAGRLTATISGTRTTLRAAATGTNEWKKVSFSATLKEGANTLTLINAGGTAMYIDQIIYTPADLPAEKFHIIVREAEHGSAVADMSEAAEGDTVTLKVMPEDGYALAGWTVERGSVTVNEDGTFVMPDDNVTLTPIFKDITAIYVLDFTNLLGGTLPPGWRTVQGSSEVHEYPNTYTSGGRIFTGFTGYQGSAIYWRENCAEYGRQSNYPLTLKEGSYKLTFACAAWKGTPKYIARILDADGNVVATSSAYSATPNANGNNSASLSAAKTYELEFDIAEEDNYIISFLNNGTGFDEFLLLDCRLNSKLPPGDVNGDGVVDLTDAIMIVYYSLGVTQEGFRETAADVNGDGQIDLTDAITVVYMSLQ